VSVSVYIQREGQQYGPYPQEDIQGHLASGVLLPTDLAWQEGMPDWVPLSKFSGLKKDELAASDSSPNPSEAVPDEGRKKFITGVIGALVVIIALGIGAYFVFFKEKGIEPSALQEFVAGKRFYLKPERGGEWWIEFRDNNKVFLKFPNGKQHEGDYFCEGSNAETHFQSMNSGSRKLIFSSEKPGKGDAVTLTFEHMMKGVQTFNYSISEIQLNSSVPRELE
jgi:hypothetical protein